MNLKRVVLLILCVAPMAMQAQYYDQGAPPASIKWNHIRTQYNNIIFPADYQQQAIRVMNYLDTVRVSVAYGYRVGTMRTPVVLQTHNFASNGLVMRAPTRMELIVAPPAAMTPEPWLKQLTTHESRHTVQYNLMNRNFIKAVSYVIGDQGSLIGVALFPLWAMEGDAVLAETELSTFGRGIQPSFTIEYRAMVHDKRKLYATDKWFCGSYKDFMPDHYQFGYQMATYVWTRYGENIWDRIGDYASKYPYTIFTTKITMLKYYRNTVNNLSRELLKDLDDHWGLMPKRANSASIIPTPITSYTTYSSPVEVGDRIVAFKSDMDNPSRIVSIDPATGREDVLFHTGVVNSGLNVYDDMLVWNELRNSKLWGQKINSQICHASLQTGKRGTIGGIRQALFPTRIAEGKLAYVKYDYNGSYSICEIGRDEPLWEFPLPVSLHGLAWDDATEKLYFIAVGEGGMWIGGLSEKNGDQHASIVKRLSYSTINDLRAQDGYLYFTSTQSGFDEAHMIELSTETEFQVSTSTYGSFNPAPTQDGVVMTTYTPQGYMVATQQDFGTSIPYSLMPKNVVNPPRMHWDKGLNMDSVTVADTTSLSVKRYRKGLHMVNVHSWAPVAFDPEGVVGEQTMDINLGVTAISQDLLNTTFIDMRYALRNSASMFGANFKYYGFAPKFELSTEIGGGDQIVYNRPKNVPKPNTKTYVEVEGMAFLPLYFDNGYHTRLLQPLLNFQWANSIIYEPDGSISHGLHKLMAELQYSDQVRMATRDFLPRWGYAVRGNIATEPFNSNFSTLWTGYARINTPGLAMHHSTMLRGAYQWQAGGLYSFKQKDLYPRGANYDINPKQYMAFALDYQFPVAYLDIGIPSIIYLKRVRVNVAGNYARYRPFASPGRVAPWQNVYSYGGDIIVDMNLLRTPAPATNFVRMSIYHPSDRKGIFVGFDLSIPL